MNERIGNDLCIDILAQAINEMKELQGDSFSLEKVTLAELERHTGISQARLRKLKKDGIIIKPQVVLGEKDSYCETSSRIQSCRKNCQPPR